MPELPAKTGLSEPQRKWFASLRYGLERETGRSLEDWVAIARQCPESAHRKRLAWMKAEHGLGQNRASMVLQAAFPEPGGWAEPEALGDALWRDAQARAVFDHVRRHAMALDGTIIGQRKAYTAFSRRYQYAALKPAASGAVLGLSVDPACDGALAPAMRESWSERLRSRVVLPDVHAVTPRIVALLRAAWENS